MRVVVRVPTYRRSSASGNAIVKDGITDFMTANGTGPYKCKGIPIGRALACGRNTEYFMTSKVYLDEIDLFGSRTSQRALLASDMHFHRHGGPRLVPLIIRPPGRWFFSSNR